MAFPLVVVSGDFFPCGPPMKAPNGAIYVFVSTGTSARAYKCADPDSGSFAEQDSSNRFSITGAGTEQRWMHCCQYEHLVFLASAETVSGEQNIVAKQFNTATDSWVSGTQTVYSGGGGEPPVSDYPCYLVATPTYLYCLHPSDDEKLTGQKYARCMVSSTQLATQAYWVNSAYIGDGVKSPYVARAVVANVSENAVALYSGVSLGADIRGKVWNRSSFGSEAGPTSTAESDPTTQAVSYMDSSTNRIIVSACASSGGGYVWRLTSSGTTLTSVAETSTKTGANLAYRRGLARWGTKLWQWLANSSNNPAYTASADHGATWDGPTQLRDPTNDLTDHPWVNCYTRKGLLKAAVIWREGTNAVCYDELSISNATAPGFASARTPVRQNKILVAI